MVDRYGEFDVTAVARAAVLRAETASCASTESVEHNAVRQDIVENSLHIVQERTQCGIVKTARHRV